MSAERLREMLSEATPPEPIPDVLTEITNFATQDRAVVLARARLIALAPDAIALLADFADAVTDRRQDGTFRDDKIQAVLLRLDALCGDERA